MDGGTDGRRADCAHTYRKTPRHPCQTMHARARGFCKKRDLAAGLGVMLLGWATNATQTANYAKKKYRDIMPLFAPRITCMPNYATSGE